jgi:transketolase
MTTPPPAVEPLTDELRKALEAKAILLDRYALTSTTAAGSGHPSTATSIGHIVAVLLYHQMRWDPADPWSLTNDRLVLSEGHAVPIIYPALGDLGAMVGEQDAPRPLTLDDIKTLRRLGSVLDGHPNPAVGVPFFDAATGSLGQGASVAAGLALGARVDGSERRIYVIIGDGESREGQVWEAVDFIAENHLTNVTLIFNANAQGQSEPVSAQQSADVLAAKLRAYGVVPVTVDGHNVEAIHQALNKTSGNRPVAIVARTVKGWGVEPLLHGNWHGKPLPAAELAKGEASLDVALAATGVKDPAAVKITPPAPPAGDSSCSWEVVQLGDPDFEKLLASHPLPAVRKLLDGFKKGKMATRRAYGLALAELGRVCESVVALDGDVKNSTFAEWFAELYPARYFECRIAEQNMVSTAVGLAAAGKIPFVSTFGKFFARALDQIEMALISNANVKLCGSHSGTTLGADGPSQMSLPDVAWFRSFGHYNAPLGKRVTMAHEKVTAEAAACPVLIPCDAVSTWKLVELMANECGAFYLRTLRPDTPLLYGPTENFPLGGHKVVREGKHVVLAANGYMVFEALSAAKRLAEKGIEAAVVDAYCLPLDPAPVLALAKGCGGLIVTAEDNYQGGLGSELAEAAAAAGGVRVLPMAVRRFPKSGDTPTEMLSQSGLDAAAIAAHVANVLGR